MHEKDSTISHPHVPADHPAALTKLPKNLASSTNWSGYAAANNIATPTPGSVSAVSGTWIVPTITATVSNANASFWVGIDGYSSSTVEQLGTNHSFAHGRQQNYAWFEMYPGGSFLINGFPLNPGDVISASVIYSGSNIFTMSIANDTQKVSTSIPTSYTTSSTAVRNSAEWIVEAPYSGGILPLANFKTAYMWGCSATINSVTALINNNSWQNVGIQMVTNRSALKDKPSAILPDNGSFFVTWLGS